MPQRSANPRSADMMDVSDDSATPSPKMSAPQIIKSVVSSSNIDPALSGVSSPAERSDSGDSARDRAEEAWIENIRVIEALRKMVQERLDSGKYEQEEGDVSMSGTEPKEEKSLYPTLRADED
jgi:hypothetical protein